MASNNKNNRLLVLENVQTFIRLVHENKNYNAASVYLADDFVLQSPKLHFNCKEDWLSGFPDFHKCAPALKFEDAILSNNETTVIRKASKKIGFMNIKVMEIYAFDSEGKIQSIIVKPF
jgi:hypothetical protein